MNLEKRNIFKLKDFDIFTQFPKLEVVNVKSTEMTDVVHTNKFFSFLRAIPNLKNIECDKQVNDIIWEIYKGKKL